MELELVSHILNASREFEVASLPSTVEFHLGSTVQVLVVAVDSAMSKACQHDLKRRSVACSLQRVRDGCDTVVLFRSFFRAFLAGWVVRGYFTRGARCSRVAFSIEVEGHRNDRSVEKNGENNEAHKGVNFVVEGGAAAEVCRGEWKKWGKLPGSQAYRNAGSGSHGRKQTDFRSEDIESAP